MKGRKKGGRDGAKSGRAASGGQEVAGGESPEGAVDEETTAVADEAQATAEAAAEADVAADDPAILKDRLLRLQADFDNFRKRTLREKNELYKRANEDLMEEVLPVLDHMDMALEAAQKHDELGALTDGFRLVGEQLKSSLEKFGLTAIEAEGQPFDPNLHEAIAHVPSESAPEDVVTAQVRTGYKLGNRLLRAARVVVSSGPIAEQEAAEQAVEGE